jgi:PAS domain S-box-containing protein
VANSVEPQDGAGLDFSGERGTRLTFLLLIVLVALTIIVGGRTVHEAVDAAWWVEHTLAVERDLSELASSVRESEAAYLEYVVTGRDAVVRRSESARAAIADELQRVQQLTGDNPHQQARIVDLRRAVNEALVFGAAVVAARDQGGWEATRTLVIAGAEKGSTGVVLSLIDAMADEEKNLFRERSRRVLAETQQAVGLGAALGLVALVAIGTGYMRMRAGLRSRRRHELARAQIADHLRIITQAAHEFSSTTYDQERLLDVVARRLGELVGDMCAIRATSEDGEWLESTGAVYHRDPELLSLTREVMLSGRQRVGEGISGRVAASGQPLLTPRIETSAFLASSEPRYRAFLERFGVTSSMAIPLLSRGMVVGVANLMRSGPDRPYADDEFELVKSVAEHAALAIGNARAYAAERAARDAAERATSALRQAEARFSRLREAGILGVIVSELDGRVVDINDALLNLVGYSRDEIVSGRVAWGSLTPPEWQKVDQLAIEQLKASGVTGLREKEYLRRDGQRIPVMAGSAMLEDGTTQCISFVLDITERKAAHAALERLQQERALNEQKAKLAAIVDASDDAIIGKTLEGTITSWNQGAHNIFGYAADEVIGKSILLLIPPGREGEEPAILDDLAKGEVRRFDTVRRRKDGRDIDVSVTSSPVRDASGRVVSISKVARDITDRRHAEVALARAKDAAEAANHELEAFSYSVAHDLRAPLRGMNGFARVLLDRYREKFDAEGQDWLEEILLNAKKMGSLIDGLLSLAQWSRSALRPERVDLSAVVREVAARLRASEPNRSVEVKVRDGLHADVDPRLARALLENLLGNAWKFTSKVSAPTIEFGLTEKNGSPAFFVRDNGAGFDMAFVGKLFAPFQRLHTTEEFPGTGIGLATVQRIVHRHGGLIWADGKIDQGATFFFAFPASPTGVKPTGVN